MKTTLCTLYNSLYLDKGLVLYDSLNECAKDFELYVLCMDDKCYEVLKKENREHIVPINLEDFENEELLRLKKERKLGEYYWTCSSWLISYVLDTYKNDHCTYIDADMYFYHDPACLIEELEQRKATVMVVGHRFYPLLAEQKAWKVGKYCVEFNTFKNEEQAVGLLKKWNLQVLEHCSLDGDGMHWGDQKYLDSWDNEEYVVETKNMGAGVAPWNISQYRLVSKSSDTFYLSHYGQECQLVFYHFENIHYPEEHVANINLEVYWGIDKSLIDCLYVPYLKKIAAKKGYLNKRYGIDFTIKKHPGVEEPTAKVNILKGIANYYGLLVDMAKRNRDILFPIKYLIKCRLPKFLYSKYNIVKY